MEDIRIRGSNKNKDQVVCGITSCFLWLKQIILGLSWVRDETGIKGHGSHTEF